MLFGGNGGSLGPGQQFMSGDEAFAHLQVLFAVIGHPLGKLLCMGQKKVEVESPCLIEHLCCRKQGGAFLVIGSSLIRLAQIKEKFGRSAGLSHRLSLRTLSGPSACR